MSYSYYKHQYRKFLRNMNNQSICQTFVSNVEKMNMQATWKIRKIIPHDMNLAFILGDKIKLALLQTVWSTHV